MLLESPYINGTGALATTRWAYPMVPLRRFAYAEVVLTYLILNLPDALTLITARITDVLLTRLALIPSLLAIALASDAPSSGEFAVVNPPRLYAEFCFESGALMFANMLFRRPFIFVV